jgi:antitoxin ParD1/3/4
VYDVCGCTNCIHIMRTNIEIDDKLMEQALKAGPYKTKKEAVEAGLEMLARRAAYREILKWRGKLHWQGDESIDWTQPDPTRAPRTTVKASAPAPKPAKSARKGGRAGR